MRLIDADALKKYIDLQKIRQFTGCTIGEAMKIMMDEQPTIEERKTGRWETTRPDAPMFGFYYCSECGRKRTSPQDNYCPNCGAKMEGE